MAASVFLANDTLFDRLSRIVIVALLFGATLSGAAGPALAQQSAQCTAPPCAVATGAPASSTAPAPAPAPPAPPPASTAGVVTMTVRQIDPTGKTVEVVLPGGTDPVKVQVLGKNGPSAILKARPYDVVTATLDSAAKTPSITDITIRRPVSRSERVALGALAAAVLLGLAAIATGGRPGAFILGVDNRYSKSQFQLAIWFGAVGVAYLTAVMLRIHELGYDYIGGVSMPEKLLVLSGFSALSFGGAKMLAVQQSPAGQVKAAPPGGPRLLRDLTSDDNGVPDLGDFQMVLITLIAVALFLFSSFHDFGLLAVADTMSLKEVDSTLLSVFGLGQGAYLAKKAVPA